ncbi:hypothetical protein [Endozoicomonas sp.]|uniref:hypothetical protein n=1 Tax=Endozoicomonas sp. TaxID=1892382 RepID=UPI003AF9C71A
MLLTDVRTKQRILNETISLIKKCKKQHKPEQGYKEIGEHSYRVDDLGPRRNSRLSAYHSSADLNYQSQSPAPDSASNGSTDSEGVLTPGQDGFPLPHFSLNTPTFSNNPVILSSCEPKTTLPPFDSWASTPQIMIQHATSSSQASQQIDRTAQSVLYAADIDPTLVSESELTYMNL